MKHKVEFSTADIAQEINSGGVARSGNVELKITRNGEVSELKTDWVVFRYVEDGQFAAGVIHAFFGEDTGEEVPAVFFGTRRLGVGKYEIRDPFEGPHEVNAIYGLGRGESIGGDAFGKGELVVDEFSYSPSSTSIRGSFDFDYIDRYGVAVNVKCLDFWASRH